MSKAEALHAIVAGEEVPPASSSAAVHTEPKSDSFRDGPEPLPIAQNAAEAGCYTFITEVWSVDEDNRELTAAIRREADPRYVPLLCKRVYKSPAGTEIVRVYYCVGKYIPTPTDEYRDQAIKLSYIPVGFPFPPDAIHCLRTLWAPWDTKDARGRPYHPVEYNNNTPPEVVKVGPWLLEQMNAVRKFFDTELTVDGAGRVFTVDTTAEKLKSILEAETKADNARMEAARAEARYRVRHDWKQYKDAIEHERWSPEPVVPPLFLDLGKKG